MKKAQIYAAYFPTKKFYGVELPSQTLCGKGKSSKKALFNILFKQTFDKNRSIEARKILASNARRGLLREKKADDIILNLQEIIEHNFNQHGNLECVPMELAYEMLDRGMVQTRNEAVHFGQEMFNQYQTLYGK